MVAMIGGDGDVGKLRKRKAANQGYLGLQVFTALLACRVGYKLARIAVGKLLSETKVTPHSEGSQQLPQDEFLGEGPALSDDGLALTARDQWVLCSELAPEVPEGFRLLAQEHLPISVYHFYEQFLSIETTCLQDHHKSTGQYDFRCSRWKPDGDGRFSRVLDFMQPKKGMCSSNAHCLQQQTFSVHAGSVLVLSTDMGLEHIPYADCFRVQSFWRAEPDATGLGTNVAIHVAVPFTKRCFVKGLITGTTLGDCKSFYSDFLAKVQNSIATELLPTAAAAAAAAGQLLGNGASQGLLPAQLMLPGPQPPAAGSVVSSPFASVDAEVFVRASNSGANGGGSGGYPHQQQHRSGQLGMHRRGSSVPQQQQLQQQQANRRLSIDVTGSGAAANGLGALPSCRSSYHRPMSRAVSAKPSFAQPMAELKLASRGTPTREFITTAQAILVLLVLLVQLLTLYDNVVLRRMLTALPPAC